MTHVSWILRLTLAAVTAFILIQPADAQTEMRKGVLLLNQVRGLAARETTVSGGSLANLQTDPNFAGDYQPIFNTAATILDGYRLVQRGGFFPENRGIPRKQQLTPIEVVYYIFSLDNGNELFLYRSPTENTAQYFIRKKAASGQ